MPFIPHTQPEIDAMLSTIGADSIEQLFDEIPADLKIEELSAIPPGMSEMQVTRLLQQRAAEVQPLACYAGAGAYDHHIPAAVWEITTRGEFYSAYTPYQAEASQGTLQLIYEYQTMMAGLTGMDVSNASLYDGATSVAEAVLMAARGNRKSKSKKILMAGNLNPVYRRVTNTIVKNQGFDLVDLPFDAADGTLHTDALAEHAGSDITAVVVQYPNFFGGLADVDALTDWAHEQKALVIAVCNPVALGVLKAPGDWGEQGADIACGDGQPMGAPMASGGPYFGFMCCKQALVRQMPGRIVGRTVDLDGKEGFALTLQAREQHIRRSKATSNICTNQGLLVTAATIHMSMLGPEGLENVASHCWANAHKLATKLADVNGVEVLFDADYFHEFVVKLSKPADEVIEAMAQQGILAGVSLATDFPDLDHAMLVCVTETKTEEDLDAYVAALQEVL